LSTFPLTPACPNLACTGTFTPAELGLAHHYLTVFIKLLLLPSADPGDTAALTASMSDLMMRSDGVRSAVLAAAAVNKSALSGTQSYQKLSLGYYDKTVKYVSGALGTLDRSGPSRDLAMAVTFLYVYDVRLPLDAPFVGRPAYLEQLWGQDPSLDARKHVTGAINLMKLRYHHVSSISPTMPAWERVVAESVIYQAFYLAIRRPLSPDFDLDPDFFGDGNGNGLDKFVPICTATAQASPILGLPLQLYFLTVAVVKANKLQGEERTSRLRELREEVNLWEQRIETPVDDDPANDFTKDAMALFVLATSLLLDYSARSSDHGSASRGHPPWQVQHILRIFQRPGSCESWSGCYLGAWPVLIMGYAVHGEAEISPVRALLAQMLMRTGYGELKRISEELEGLWARQTFVF
jgi:transcription factor-like protein